MLRTDSSKYVGALIEYLLSVVTAQAAPGRSLQSRGLSVHLGLTGSAPCAVVCRVRPAPPAAHCATRSPRPPRAAPSQTPRPATAGTQPQPYSDSRPGRPPPAAPK